MQHFSLKNWHKKYFKLYLRFRLPYYPVSDRRRCSGYSRFSTAFHFRLRQRVLTTENMAASSDRNPPPFPATEEPGPGRADMADGDIDEGEDIFVNNVCSQLLSMIFERSVIVYPLRVNEPVTVPLYLIRRAVMES